MFTSKHYVPILKWKRAEQVALEMLEERYKNHISPLIELVMPKPKSLFKDKKKKIKKTVEELFNELIEVFRTNRIFEIPDEIIKYWGSRPAFIDFSLLYTLSLKTESIKIIIENATKKGAVLIPILNLSDNEEIKKEIRNILKKYNHGVCFRIVAGDLQDTNKLNNDLEHILQYLNVTRDNIDLLVDIKENGEAYDRYFNLSQEINGLGKWRNFIFACGTFPENLKDCNIDEPKLIPRVEWIGWLSIRGNQIKRVPIFSDYTVRNPIYNEKLQFYHSTSSIKYALENDWLILKGKKKRFDIYLASAAELIKDQRFYKEGFSYGDKFIAEKAKHFKLFVKNPEIKGTGNTEMWLRAFINHHLTLTVHKIANLS